ncbi:glycosyltransferase family 2 protein [candidate division KSB1 bacterium]|nr:glycosyltransferase [candidate division KSB1 bacterium]RQW00965.1 MAG: glycosyltransferase family 2 protein [candidate division KSB1 bacterium]
MNWSVIPAFLKSRTFGPLTLNQGETLSATNPENARPLVSIVIPMLNERDAIERCINSIFAQDYPADRLEIVIVDGLSDDGSQQVVTSLMKEHHFIKLLENPTRRTPASLNIGVRHAAGDVIVILGAHTTIERQFVSTNIKYMNELGVKCTGGTQINVGETYLQRAIGFGMGSVFGIPSAPYRFFPKKRFVDTVVYAAYKRQLFDEVGYFDEELCISEDAEFNWRIRKAGNKIFYTPEIISYYYPRKNLFRLFKQFFNYGIFRVNVMKKHIDSVKLIHFLPPLFVATMVVLSVGGFFVPLLWKLAAVVLALYILYIILGAFLTAGKVKKIHYVPVLPPVFATMHISWGTGFLVGMVKK